MSYSACYPFSVIFSFLSILQVLQCAILIFHLFQCFSPYSRSSSVFVSFSTFFLISRHLPGPTMCISHFPLFSVFLAIFQVLQCVFLIFHDFQFSRHIPPSYSVHFPFANFFSVSRHIPGHTVFVSHFQRFSVFLAIFQILQSLFIFFTFFRVSRHISHHTVCVSQFP